MSRNRNRYSYASRAELNRAADAGNARAAERLAHLNSLRQVTKGNKTVNLGDAVQEAASDAPR